MSHKRKQEDARRLRKLYSATRNSYPGVYYDTAKKRLIRFTAADFGGRTSYLKRRANKIVRRQPLDENAPALKGAAYRRLYDYRWQLY